MRREKIRNGGERECGGCIETDGNDNADSGALLVRINTKERRWLSAKEVKFTCNKPSEGKKNYRYLCATAEFFFCTGLFFLYLPSSFLSSVNPSHVIKQE